MWDIVWVSPQGHTKLRVHHQIVLKMSILSSDTSREIQGIAEYYKLFILVALRLHVYHHWKIAF